MENEKLTRIRNKNPDIKDRIINEGWSIRYNRKTDMIIIGKEFPKGSFYTYIGDTGVMLRIDNEEKIHGYAFENAKTFVRQNQELGDLLYPFVHPIKFRMVVLMFRIMTNINNMSRMFRVNEYVMNYQR